MNAGRSFLVIKQPYFEKYIDIFCQDDSWRYGSVGDNLCPATTSNCLPIYCGAGTVLPLVLINSAKEEQIGLGRNWNFQSPPVGTAILNARIMSSLGLEEGSSFYFDVSTADLLTTLTARGFENTGGFTNSSHIYRALVNNFGSFVTLPLRVSGSGHSGNAKIGDGGKGFDDDFAVVMEFDSFLPFLLEHMHTALRTSDTNLMNSYLTSFGSSINANVTTVGSVAELARVPLEHFVHQIFWNLPPPRVDVYIQESYEELQRDVVTWATTGLYKVGFPEVDVRFDVLDFLDDIRFLSLFFGLMLSIILTILFLLSCVLLYSLLMISVETRTFEIGVHRMVGLGTKGVIGLLITQAFSFSVPAWAVGLIIAQSLASYAIKVIEELVNVPMATELTGRSVISATLLGLLIPLFASILPIQQSLSSNLHDTLDTQHSKTKAVKITVERSEHAAADLAWPTGNPNKSNSPNRLGGFLILFYYSHYHYSFCYSSWCGPLGVRVFDLLPPSAVAYHPQPDALLQHFLCPFTGYAVWLDFA